MIEASLYQSMYLAIVGLLTIVVNTSYASVFRRQRIRSTRYSRLCFFLAISLSLFIGMRPVSGRYFVDMAGYNSNYMFFWGEPMDFNWSTTNFIFDNMFMFMASKQIPVSVFFVLMAAMYFLCTFFACKKLFPEDTMLSFLVFLGAFSTFSYATNGMKAGVASAWFLLAIAFRGKFLLSILMALISFGFHHSMQLPLVAYLLILMIRNPKVYMVIWGGALLIALLHITYFQDLFAGMTDEQGAGYLSYEMDEYWANVIRFRLDFVLYSSVPIIVGYWFIVVKHFRSKEYDFILSLYILTNAVWMLCMYATFTNRIAYLSWFLYPIVLIFPFLKHKSGYNQNQVMRIVVLAHFLFTVFMAVIYY